MPDPDSAPRYGILGGTFDPIHQGHLSLATQIRSKLSLDKVLFVPAFHHPFKNPVIIASFENRHRMIELAIAGQDCFQLSDIERSGQLSGCTIDTVRALKATFERVEWLFIIGSDNLAEVAGWRDFETLQSEIRFAVGARPGRPLELPEGYDPSRFELVPIDEVDLSASGIRDRLKRGEARDLHKLVPPSVADYIKERGLYS
ncbi:MAG: nicotinate-nucleotide adenylyltransferase [bacterium]|nr:nicotinate-nucleotide adenylyltransferase [bacterium]